MQSHYPYRLQKIFEVQEKIQDIHPFLQKQYPVAIVEDGHFLIYDVEPGCRQYSFVKKTAVPMPIPQGVRAAFPLESYENRMACVVTSDVFARFIENQINGRLNLPENHGGKEKPFNRVVFYKGGAHYIQLLSQQEAQLAIDIEKLFDRMSKDPFVDYPAGYECE